MAVETTTRKTSQNMDEAITEYTFTFRALISTPSDIKCIRKHRATEVLETMEYVADLPETPTEDDVLKYTVDVNDSGIGGTVTVAYASSDSYEITIYRETTDTQSSVYDDYNQFPASTVENDFDRRTMISQERDEDISRAVKVSITESVVPTLPSPSANRIIGWNSDGDDLENKLAVNTDDVAEAEAWATSASSSAVTAGSYATIAEEFAGVAEAAAEFEVATQLDAETGTNNSKLMTPLRTSQNVAANLLDEDDMASDSATKAPTQQSVKAYIGQHVSVANLLHIQDQKAQNVQGGTFTSGAWRTRALNTKLTDNITGASLASNQITLPTGTYYIDASAPACGVKQHQAILYNISDSSVSLVGTSEYTYDTPPIATRSFISGVVTIAAEKIFEVQHRCSDSRSTNGLGVNANMTTEVFTDIKIWKVA